MHDYQQSSTYLGLLLNELLHQLFALLVIYHHHLDAAAPQELLFAHVGRVLADNDAGNLVQEDGAGAHAAWAERI